MKKITNFTINQDDLAAAASSRQFIVNGEEDAECMIQAFDSSDPVKFYDFTSKSFTTGFTSTNNLKVKMKGDRFVGAINFPAASSNVYNILLLAPPNKDTELDFGFGKNSYKTSITQISDAILTFTSSSANSTSYETLPTTTSTGSSAETSSVVKNIAWTIENQNTDAKGYGLRLTRQPLSTDWYFQAAVKEIVSNPNGDGVASGMVYIADITDLVVGMELIYHKSTTAPSVTTYVTAIETVSEDSHIITFSSEVEFENEEDMTFRAYGAATINNAIGVDLDLSGFNEDTETAVAAPLSKTVRATGTNETIALNNTYGISGGGYVTISGVNVTNTSDNTVQTVVADATGAGDGTVTVGIAQTAALAVGTTIHFYGSTTEIVLSNKITVNSHPTSSRYIYLDLDKFIALGTDGS